MRKIF